MHNTPTITTTTTISTPTLFDKMKPLNSWNRTASIFYYIHGHAATLPTTAMATPSRNHVEAKMPITLTITTGFCAFADQAFDR